MNRRSFLKKLFTSMIGMIGLSGGTYYYAKEIEPSLLHIHRETITSKKIPSPFKGFTIAQFSDTHIGFHYTLEQFNELVTTLNTNRPDIVVFTGDLVDMPNKYNWSNKIIDLLSKIEAPYGKFWIYGNHDHGGYGTDIVKDVMDKGGFTLLKNSNTSINKEGDSITLIGIDDVMLGKPNMELALDGIKEENFSILLVHEPDYAETVKNYAIDVQFSGHSHGGQVQIPFLGYVYTPAYAQKYVEGSYMIGTNPLLLFVSRGIGTTRLPYRFLCKPEVSFYKLLGRDTTL